MTHFKATIERADIEKRSEVLIGDLSNFFEEKDATLNEIVVACTYFIEYIRAVHGIELNVLDVNVGRARDDLL